MMSEGMLPFSLLAAEYVVAFDNAYPGFSGWLPGKGWMRLCGWLSRRDDFAHISGARTKDITDGVWKEVLALDADRERARRDYAS